MCEQAPSGDTDNTDNDKHFELNDYLSSIEAKFNVSKESDKSDGINPVCATSSSSDTEKSLVCSSPGEKVTTNDINYNNYLNRLNQSVRHSQSFVYQSINLNFVMSASFMNDSL